MREVGKMATFWDSWARMSRGKTLREVWPVLEASVAQVIKRQEEGISETDWMNLYT
jgi:hypothetical protein